MTAPLTTETKMLWLEPAKKRRLRYYATSLRDFETGVELVIGARTKKAVMEAFARLAPGFRADPKKVYYVEAREVKK